MKSIIVMVSFLLFTVSCTNSVKSPDALRGNQEKTSDFPYKYVYLGEQREDGPLYVRSEDDYTIKDRYGVYTREGGCVRDAQTAILIARAVLAPICGYELLDSRQPYKVTLVNDTIWHIMGTMSPSVAHGKIFTIDINKKDARIMLMALEK